MTSQRLEQLAAISVVAILYAAFRGVCYHGHHFTLELLDLYVKVTTP
jgi:hypothetical protein